MEVLEIYDNNEDGSLKDHLIRIGDLINIDGPVLSLFQDNRNDELYLFDWVEADENANRWLIYKVGYEVLNDFLSRKISYREMFNSALYDKFYVADIINSDEINYSIQRLGALPTIYLSTKDVFLDISDAIDFDKIYQVVKKGLQKNEFSSIEPLTIGQGEIKRSNLVNSILIFPQSFLFLKQTEYDDLPLFITTTENHVPNNFNAKSELQRNAGKNNRLSSKERMDIHHR